jgi:DNA mismatch repair protein MutL
MSSSVVRSIRQLDSHSASMIRSACALPRFAAIVEELVLNSLDAGATTVHVAFDVQESMITVRDDGHGMTGAELSVVGERHATSKLVSLTGLEHGITTYGFRGEALHCLASICLLEITSCSVRSPQASNSVTLRYGQRLACGPSQEARSAGTTVIARDCFSNRPIARRQLQTLGAAQTEAETVRKRCAALSLANPSASLCVVDHARQATVLRAPRMAGTLASLRAIVGGSHLPPLGSIQFQDSSSDFAISGYAAFPPHGFSSREVQFVFLNRRPLSRRSELHRIVDTALDSLHAARAASAPLAPGPASAPRVQVYPAFVLFVRCAPHRFDLTLEPDKSEVHAFSKSQPHSSHAYLIRPSGAMLSYRRPSLLTVGVTPVPLSSTLCALPSPRTARGSLRRQSPSY